MDRCGERDIGVEIEHTNIRHHHRHMAQYITIHQYHTADLQRHWFPQSLSGKKIIIIHLPLYICLSVYLFISPTHISSNLIPEARASFPGERVNVTELPLQTPQRCCLCCCLCCCCCCFPFLPARYSTEIFKQINPGRHVSAPLLPTAPSMEQPVVWQWVLAPSLPAHSGRQLVGSCRFSSKLHKQSKLEVQPSLEAKPLWAIHTPVPVRGQWLKPPAYSRPLPPSPPPFVPPSLAPSLPPLLPTPSHAIFAINIDSDIT